MMKQWKIMVLCSAVFLSACQLPAPIDHAVQGTVENLKRLLGMPIQPKPEAKPASPQTEETRLKANQELLAEMIQTTFKTEKIEDANQFNELVSSLNQGASLEGIYRGLVMGSKYRVLESKSKAASPNTLKFFALEMAEIQSKMKAPSRFNRETAKLAPSIDYPEGDLGDTPDELDFTPMTSGTPVEKTKEQIASELLQIFIGATPYTLKRVIAEEAMKKMDEMGSSSGELAQWYAGLVVRLSQSKTDFGLPQRNSPDFDFHFKFANTMSTDRVKWEVLNRYHRILNRLDQMP